MPLCTLLTHFIFTTKWEVLVQIQLKTSLVGNGICSDHEKIELKCSVFDIIIILLKKSSTINALMRLNQTPALGNVETFSFIIILIDKIRCHFALQIAIFHLKLRTYQQMSKKRKLPAKITRGLNRFVSSLIRDNMVLKSYS